MPCSTAPGGTYTSTTSAPTLTGADPTTGGCDDEGFLAAYQALEPRYAATAID